MLVRESLGARSSNVLLVLAAIPIVVFNRLATNIFASTASSHCVTSIATTATLHVIQRLMSLLAKRALFIAGLLALVVLSVGAVWGLVGLVRAGDDLRLSHEGDLLINAIRRLDVPPFATNLNKLKELSIGAIRGRMRDQDVQKLSELLLEQLNL